jgi:NADH:ubiquinone oxidoreductase subunit 5 (subunit L)/multisubunit Na+/H+ antiporter MnhA subunit
MSVMVVIITLSVIYYSFDYMREDPHFIRFISYINLFAFFMLILVYSSNLFVLFLGWEGVGLCSFLLVSF